VGTNPGNANVQFLTRDTEDEHRIYDVSVSKTPGDMAPANSRCQSSRIDSTISLAMEGNTWAQRYACMLKPNSLYYANVQAAGDKAELCGDRRACHMRLVAW
jgi:hypothetical protein